MEEGDSMSGVDNRVVKMSFDNGQFKAKTAETISAVDKLKASLNFDSVKNSLSGVKDTIANFKSDNLTASLDSHTAKWLAFGSVVTGVISGLALQGIRAAGTFVKSLAIEPIMQGFTEYETNMNSVQTIMANTASKGTTLQQVNSTLDEMNEFSDKTIYNFAEMAKNVGTFTAAGVDLDTAKNSIKGIATISAISGANSEQAATAMQQLSQAMSAGQVRLQDWMSVEKAGIGGEILKKQLFETGKAAGTLSDVPLDQTFEQWEKANGAFRTSLDDGWLTADVLSTALSSFNADVDEAALKSQGYTDTQIAEIKKLQKLGEDATTKVKTFTQLKSTVKESIASGWSGSARLIIGDFEQAQTLFTGINNFIGSIVSNSADARNKLITDANAATATGGFRDNLIGGFMSGIAALKGVLDPLRMAFRSVFPRQTGEQLSKASQGFAKFMQILIPAESTVRTIANVFVVVFRVLKFGMDIVGMVWRLFGNLASTVASLFGGGGGGLASATGVLVTFTSALQEGSPFMERLDQSFQKAMVSINIFGTKLNEAKDKVIDFVEKFKFPSGLTFVDIIEKIKTAFAGLSSGGDDAKNKVSGIGDAFTSVSNTLNNAWESIKRAVSSITSAIGNFFSGIGDTVTNAFTSDIFAPVLGSVGVGFVGGILFYLRKLQKDGLSIDFLGIKEKFESLFDGVKGSLTDFQNNIKSRTLMNIAKALAVLTISLIALSFIDPVKLAIALAAVGTGLSQLVGAMILLDQTSSTKDMVGLASAVLMLSAAIAVLAIAVLLFSTMSWEEIGKGLVGVTGAIVVMAAGAKLMSGNSSSFIKAAFSLIFLSVGLAAFALVVKLFATMGLAEMGKGLLGVAVSMGVFVAAVNLLPKSDIARIGLGFLLFGYGLTQVYNAVVKFSTLGWGEMFKGFFGIAVGLKILTNAMDKLPKDTLSKAAGLLVMAFALRKIAEVIQMIGSLSLETLAKGLIAMGLALWMITAATNSMSGALPGAAAMIVVSGALFLLAQVIKTIGELPLEVVMVGIIGIAAVLAVLAAAAILMTPILPALNALGIALMLIGGGFALFGIGVAFLAEGLIRLGEAGKKGVKALVEILNVAIAALPGFIEAFAKGLVKLIITVIDAAPQIIEALAGILIMILDKIIEIVPKIIEVLGTIISGILLLIIEKTPELVAAGFSIFMSLLRGIRVNIGEITTMVVDIIANFVNALAQNLQKIIDAGVNLLVAFINGITTSMAKVTDAITLLITTMITEIGNNAVLIAAAGTDALVKFLDAIGNDAAKIIAAVGTLVTTLITAFTNEAIRISTAGKDAAIKFLDGLVDNTIDFVDKALKLLIALLDGLTKAIEDNSPKINASALKLMTAIVDGMLEGVGGLASKLAEVGTNLAKSVWDAATGFFKVNSPSKKFIGLGHSVVEGLVVGIDDGNKSAGKAGTNLAKTTVDSFTKATEGISYGLANIGEFNPRITPVLDLSNVQKDAKSLTSMLGTNPLSASLSLSNAKVISAQTSQEGKTAEIPVQATSGGVTFEQNIYAPTALNANDIYRNTRSQITLAKEELSIP